MSDNTFAFTLESFNEDTLKLEYLHFEVVEGDECVDREGRSMVITGVEDGYIYVCENGNADTEECWGESEVSRYFAPTLIEVAKD